MGMDANVYVTGLGSIGQALGGTSSKLFKSIDGQEGKRIAILNAQVRCGFTGAKDALVFMKVLGHKTVASAVSASDSTVDVGTSAGLLFTDGDGTVDTAAADDVVAIKLDDGTFHFDWLAAVVATNGTYETDTAITGDAAVGNPVYVFGSTANAGHMEVAVATDPADNKYGDILAVSGSKGDPMVILMTASSTGGAANGNHIDGIVYAYVNK